MNTRADLLPAPPPARGAADPGFDRALAEMVDRSQARIEFTPEGEIVSVNAAFCAAMGYRPHELVGQHHRMFCDPGWAASPDYAAFWARLRAGEVFTAEIQRFARGARPVWLRATYAGALDAEGRVARVFKIATDVTAQKERALVFQRALNQIAAGELRVSVDVEAEGDDARVRDAIRASADGLVGLIRSAQGIARTVDSAAAEVAGASADLARSAARQAEGVEEMGGALRQVAQQAAQSSAALDEAARLASGAAERARSGDAQTHALIQAIEAIDARIGSVSTIGRSINEIAFQTNLLALNAGVEAARVGVHGRGFAVVAEEVRRLAHRAAEAAKAAEEHLQAVRATVQQSRAASGAAVEAFVGISADVRAVDAAVAKASTLGREQARAAREMSVALEEIEQTTVATSAAAEQASATAAQLRREGRALQGELGRFQLPDPPAPALPAALAGLDPRLLAELLRRLQAEGPALAR
jgi:methyl-accepting chemotaxis protein